MVNFYRSLNATPSSVINLIQEPELCNKRWRKQSIQLPVVTYWQHEAEWTSLLKFHLTVTVI